MRGRWYVGALWLGLAPGCAGLSGLTGGGSDGGTDGRTDGAIDEPGADIGDAGASRDTASGDGPKAPPADSPGPPAESGGDSSIGTDSGEMLDVGTVETGTMDAGSPVSCANAGVFLCDDFENGYDATKWPTVQQALGSIAIDTTHAHRGSHSLHAHGNGVTDGGSQSIVVNWAHSSAVPTTVFLRLYVYQPSPAPVDAENFLYVQQNVAPYPGMQLELDNGFLGLTNWANTPNVNIVSNTPVTQDAWSCIEWGISSGAAQVWLNDAPIQELSLTGLVTPAYDTIAAGLGFFMPSSEPAADLWIDDIFVDTSRVGCAK